MASNSIDPHLIVNVDYSQYDEEVQKLKPTLFREENGFCCLSGPDRETGIFGCGVSVYAAIEAWRSALEERLMRLNGEDQ